MAVPPAFLFSVVLCVSVVLSFASAQTVTPLTPGTAVTGSIPARAWVYYSIDVAQGVNELSISMTQTSTAGDPDVYVKKGANPTTGSYDAADWASGTAHSVVVRRGTSASQKLGTGTYFIGIYNVGTVATTFSLTATNYDCFGANCSGHGTCDMTGNPTFCRCQPAWNNSEDCSIESVEAVVGQQYGATLAKSQAKFYNFYLTSYTTFELLLQLTPSSVWGLTVVIGRNRIPTPMSNDGFARYDYSTKTTVLTVRKTASIVDFTGKWVVAVYNSRYTNQITYSNLKIQLHDCPNQCSGNGLCDPISNACTCFPGFGGGVPADCSFTHTPLDAVAGAAPTTVMMLPNTMAYYAVNVTNFEINTQLELLVKINVGESAAGTPRLFLGNGSYPTASTYFLQSALPLTNTQTLRVSRSDLTTGTWYIGIQNANVASYNVTLSAQYDPFCDPNCLANGVCNNVGECSCNYGWIGNDCSVYDPTYGKPCPTIVPTGWVAVICSIFLVLGTGTGYFAMGKLKGNAGNQERYLTSE